MKVWKFLVKSFVLSHTGLRGVKRELLLALTKCQRVKACQEVLEEYEIGKLDVNQIDYDAVIFEWHKCFSRPSRLLLDLCVLNISNG